MWSRFGPLKKNRSTEVVACANEAAVEAAVAVTVLSSWELRISSPFCVSLNCETKVELVMYSIGPG